VAASAALAASTAGAAGAAAGSAADPACGGSVSNSSVSKQGSDRMRTSIETSFALCLQPAAYYKKRGGSVDAFGYDRSSTQQYIDISDSTITINL